MSREGIPPVCVALDVASEPEALALIEQLRSVVSMFKIGLELFVATGPALVETVAKSGVQVFLDLKIHDIPTTAAAAVKQAGQIGAWGITIHASGGREMLQRAVDASGESSIKLLAVTTLTSLDDEALAEVGLKEGAAMQVGRLAKIADAAGVHGLVLSAREVAGVRQAYPESILCVPGVRPAGSGTDDHKRTHTPGQAIASGADFVVVGRPILSAEDPLAAAIEIVHEVEGARVS